MFCAFVPIYVAGVEVRKLNGREKVKHLIMKNSTDSSLNPVRVSPAILTISKHLCLMEISMNNYAFFIT